MKPPTAPWSHARSLAFAMTVAAGSTAHAESNASQISDASLVSVAVSVALPVALVAGVGSVVVTGVEASAQGTVWVIENVADGVKGSICFAGRVVGTVVVAVGTVLVVTAVDTGMVLSAAGRVVAFIPNEIGRSLSYNQRVSQ